MWAVHPVFHISMLKPTHENTIQQRIQLPPPPVVIDSEPEHEVSEILDSKINKCWKHCNIIYLVWWTGYEGTDEETSWILANELGHTSEIVADFHKAYPDKLLSCQDPHLIAKINPLPLPQLHSSSETLTLC